MPKLECDSCGACCKGHLFIECDEIDVLREPRLIDADRHHADELSQLVCGPITANYPQCALTTPELEGAPTDSADDETWSSELSLVPELFPILRHGL